MDERSAAGPLLLFAVAGIGYSAIGAVLAIRYGYILGDALSRTADAGFAIDSRQPHLSAIGFIFGPLPTVAQLPLVALRGLCPDLVRYGLSGDIVSALFMAGFLVQLAGTIEDRGASRGWAYGITASVALQPMIVIYAANGMSEAPFLFLITWAVRRLIRWQRTDDVHDLITAGLAIGICYLVRYEALVAIAAAVAVVAVRHWRRGWRLASAFMDAAIISLPVVITFGFWTATSWLISGDAFAQFSSVYGNSAILQYSQSAGGATSTGLSFPIIECLVLSPLIVVIAVLAGVLAVRRRDPDVLPIIALFGGILAFEAYSVVKGSTFPFLRYYILIIPAAALLVATLRPGIGSPRSRRAGPYQLSPRPGRRSTGGARIATTVAAIALLVVPVPLSLKLLNSPTRAPQEFALSAVIDAETATPNALAVRRTFATERQLAAYLDAMRLGNGTILLDTLYGFAVVAASRDPKQFIVPSDRDYIQALNDPSAYGVRYLLAVPDSGRGQSDAVNRRYPTLFDTGAGIAVLALDIPNEGANQPEWRLYRITSTETGN